MEKEFRSPMAEHVEERLTNGSRITIDPKIKPRLPVVKPLKSRQLIRCRANDEGLETLERQRGIRAAVESSKLWRIDGY